MFGGGEPAAESTVAAPPPSESRLAAGLAAKEDPTDIGGLLYLRLDYAALDAGAAEEFPLASRNLLDVYFDSRPNERVRGYVRGRVIHDPTVQAGDVDRFGAARQTNRVLLDQMWLKADLGRALFFTVGRQPIRWGSGRFWNPTDFMNSQVRDPLAVFDERNGVALVKLHLPVEALGWNFYAVANLEGADTPEQIGAGARAEFLFAQTEIALSAAIRDERPVQLGVDVSTGVGLFDLRGEAAFQHGVSTPFFRGEVSLPEVYSREEDWIAQAVAGAEVGIRYSDQDNIIVGAEYFFNDAGYRDRRLYPWLLANRAFQPLYVGRHYAGLYAVAPAPGSWNDTTIILSGLSNLSDTSYLARLDWQVRVLTYVTFNAYGAYHFGEPGELRFGLDIPPGALPQLAEGLSLVPPLFDVGVAVRVSM